MTPPDMNPAQPKVVPDTTAGKAALTEAARHVDIIHTSLVGMAAIVLVLLYAVALPVFGHAPVTQKTAFGAMIAASLLGIAYLYYVNYRVHQHVSNQARLTEVLVNSLGQGFLSFNREGLCGYVYSQACLALLEGAPVDKNIMDVLRVPQNQRSDFKDWLEILFMPNHALGFDDVVKFLPQTFPHSAGHRINLMYRPIRGKDGEMTHVVVIATDQTEEFMAQEMAKQQQNYADMICRIFKERNQFLATITHARKFIEMAAMPVTRETAAPLLRSLHTLKAAVKHFHLGTLGDTVHKLEGELRSEAMTSDEVFMKCLSDGRKLITDGLTSVLEEVKELVGVDYEQRGNLHEVEEEALYDFAREMEAHHVAPKLIRHFLSNIAAVPAQDCFRQFERELYDLAEMIGKQIKPLRYTGTNPRVLTQPMQEFLFSLTHVCRNIVDHGIEPPVTRLARGKDPFGQVSIHTEVVPDENKVEWLHIVISDDGNGIDPSRIRARLSTVDPQGNWRHEDDQTVIQRILSGTFSTREEVTDLSGRGIGMEVVKREVLALGGTIKVVSELYRGVRFDIKIPYTLDLRTQALPQLPVVNA